MTAEAKIATSRRDYGKSNWGFRLVCGEKLFFAELSRMISRWKSVDNKASCMRGELSRLKLLFVAVEKKISYCL